MGIEIPAPVAGIGGGALVLGGGAVAITARRQLQSATSLSPYASPSQVLPALRDLQATLVATDDVLGGVQRAMDGAQLPGTGMFRRVPFIGSAADDLERAVRLGAAARELGKVDETAFVGAARQLTERSSQLVVAAEADVLRLADLRGAVGSSMQRLVLGGGVAAAGAILLGSALFDVE